MADSWRQALRMLRAQGPFYVVGFAVSRLVATVRLWRLVRRSEPGQDLESLVALVVDRPLGPAQPVFAMQRREEISAFLARAVALRPRVVVELGTASGGTLLLLARASASDALLVSVDLPGGAFGGGYQRWRGPLYRSFATAQQQIVLLRGSSHAPAMLARVRAALGGRPIDLLFIDGDHRYEGVKADYEAYSPFVRAGGLVALHDIVPDPLQEGMEVSRLWREVAATRRSEELVAAPDQRGYGIGLLWMDPR